MSSDRTADYFGDSLHPLNLTTDSLREELRCLARVAHDVGQLDLSIRLQLASVTTTQLQQELRECERLAKALHEVQS